MPFPENAQLFLCSRQNVREFRNRFIDEDTMRELLTKTMDYALKNWERWLFGIVGLACLGLAFRSLLSSEVAAGSALFGMAFFSFFYSNLARFKRFKGLGFEAELWEDKQKQAADLIDRLKSIVSVYTREIVMNNVMRGRWSDGESWTKRWALYDELTGQHTELGQEIDFSDLKHEMDSVFLFDICRPLASSLKKQITMGRTAANEHIRQKYGSPVTDLEGHNADHAKLREVQCEFDDLFERAKTENIAQEILKEALSAKALLAAHFEIEVEFDQEVVERLEAMTGIIDKRPVTVTPKLIEWAHWREEAS